MTDQSTEQDRERAARYAVEAHAATVRALKAEQSNRALTSSLQVMTAKYLAAEAQANEWETRARAVAKKGRGR